MTLQDQLRDARIGAPPPAQRPRLRWDLVAAWAVILGPALGMAIWIGLRQRVGELEERFVRDANATFARPILRPVHVDRPTPGTFGDAVVRHLPAVQRWADSVKDDSSSRDAARDVVAGKRPLSALPPAYAAALVSLSEPLDGLLAGTRAEKLDLPLAPGKWLPAEGTDWTGYQGAALFAGLRARRALSAGDPGAALSECLDGLALGRDAAISSSLVGHMVGAAIVKRLWAPCADALARLGGAQRQAGADRVRALRDALPSVAEMYRVDFLGMEVMAFGRVIAPDVRARLVPLALAQIPAEPAQAAWERLVARDAWPSMRTTWDELLRIAAAPRADEREAGFAAVLKRTERFVNPLAAIATPAGHAKYARRAEAAVARMDLIVLSAAASGFREWEGRWPASIGELSGVGLLTHEESARLAEARLAASSPLGPLAMRLLVRTVDEKEPEEELLLEVRPPARARPAAAR